MIWRFIFWLCNPSLYSAIQRYRVTDDAQMPLAYHDVPGGRPLHNDWGIMSDNPILKFLQPYQRIRRMDCAYRIPLPCRLVSGKNEPAWRQWDLSYPQAPGVVVEMRGYFPFALTDECQDGLGVWAAYINNEWRVVFREYRKMIFGRRFSWYWGLKQDLTVAIDENGKAKSDLMAWFPEFSVSWIKI